jgi:hypothetical protein
MSTDGTKPPSIAPKKPRTSTRTASGSTRTDGATTGEQARDESARTRSVTPPLSGDSAPSLGIKRPGDSGARTSGSTSTVQLAEAPPSTSPATLPRTTQQSSSATSSSAGTSTGASTSSMTSSSSLGTPRKVRLAVARLDPWSVMKLSFLLSVAIGIMIVVAAAVVWYTLDGLAVFTSVNSTIAEITGDDQFFNLLEYAAFKRVISLATMIAVVDVVIMTALSTIGAFLYNIVAALVGGITVTLTDD